MDLVVNHSTMEFTKVINSKSLVWKHFTKNAHSEKAKCNKCGNILSIKQGSTKSLIGHLKNIHKISLESSNKIKHVNHGVNFFSQQKRSRYHENLDQVLDVSEVEDVDINIDENDIDENLDPNVTIGQNEFIEIEKRKKARAHQIESNLNNAISET